MVARALAAGLFAVFLSAACTGSVVVTAEEATTEHFLSVANPKLVVDTFNGRIEVTARSGSDVSVTVAKVGAGGSSAEAKRDLQYVGVSVQREGSTIQVIAARSDGGGHSSQSAVRVEVGLPPGSNLNLKTANGEIKVSGVSGGIVAETGDGDIHVAGAFGQVSARSGNGEVTIEGERLTVDARTENGEVSLTGSLTGSLSQLRSGNGAITADLPPDADFRLEASTITGTVTCSFKLPGADTSAKTNLNGATSPGAKTLLAIHTNNGNITVR